MLTSAKQQKIPAEYVMQRIDNPRILAAVLTAQPYLSGSSDAEFNMLKHKARTALHPVQVAMQEKTDEGASRNCVRVTPPLNAYCWSAPRCGRTMMANFVRRVSRRHAVTSPLPPRVMRREAKGCGQCDGGGGVRSVPCRVTKWRRSTPLLQH